MLYLKETFNLVPASPATQDAFVDLAQAHLVPAYERLGARLVGAWFGHVEWYGQITQVLEFDDLAGWQAFRAGSGDDVRWRECESRLEQLAPQRSAQLLEPLGPIPPRRVHDAIRESRGAPLDTYTLAVLEVAPGKMAAFAAAVDAVKERFPIIASWRAVTGNPSEVIDLWQGALGREPYRPADEGSKAFFGLLRAMAPRERLVNLCALPYSPLR